MTIGERIKQARKANRMSMRNLAGKADISAMAISKYERDMDTPSSGVLLRLANALNVSIDFFFRTMTISIQLQIYRKHSALGIKEQEVIQVRIQEWLERYLEVESFFEDAKQETNLPHYMVFDAEKVEKAAIELRDFWNLGLDPIEDLTLLLEDHGIKVGMVQGFEHFDACTFMAEQTPIIVTKAALPGDRQRFNLGHELGHLILEINEKLDAEKISNRFVGAFLAPAQSVRFELGYERSTIDMQELYLLKQKYGMSMQAWIYRAKDLEIITKDTATRLFHNFRVNGWYRLEPGKALPTEKPLRMERLIYRALAEDLITRSRAQELLGEPLKLYWTAEVLQQDGSVVDSGH
jgi:transcriptional regulator with XRE-family HTH domain